MCCNSNSQNPTLRTRYNDDLVPITVEDSELDESHKILNHESNFVQGQSSVKGVQSQAGIGNPQILILPRYYQRTPVLLLTTPQILKLLLIVTNPYLT